mmetsp:Transcript_56436/g.160793  ORF Transcript_56436/g.160793 Transcript_56436/m.160793 type:complete len:248 (-) Transcript_56436:20-763(-)
MCQREEEAGGSQAEARQRDAREQHARVHAQRLRRHGGARPRARRGGLQQGPLRLCAARQDRPGHAGARADAPPRLPPRRRGQRCYDQGLHLRRQGRGGAGHLRGVRPAQPPRVPRRDPLLHRGGEARAGRHAVQGDGPVGHAPLRQDVPAPERRRARAGLGGDRGRASRGLRRLGEEDRRHGSRRRLHRVQRGHGGRRLRVRRVIFRKVPPARADRNTVHGTINRDGRIIDRGGPAPLLLGASPSGQ